MPELPEVEVVRRQLEPVWAGATITRVRASKTSYFFVSSPALLRRKLLGRTTQRLTRAGKYILAEFEDSSRLLCHLGMTGQITSRPLPADPHVHLRLELDSGLAITFRDVRKFGKVEYIAPEQSSPRLDKLGTDALTISASDLKQGFRGRKIAVKSALLDQSVVAGIGNIYADEALFAVGLRPTRAAGQVTGPELKRLAQAVRRILRTSVQRGGSTINDYIQPDGQLGGYQNWHKVYGKTDEPCPQCKRPITREVIGGRSSHFCLDCQP